ncbi:MAG TPA: hypothetical protein VL500_00425 [Candidatus Eisenbacteria bacterium]|nr:hypothetical protein [Candidatus Eisenbacteria bacterium]
MVGSLSPIVLCIVLAAAATAAIIHRYVPSPEAFAFRRMFAWLAVKRAFITCRHAFDPDARRVDRYSRAMTDLETAIEIRDGLERRIRELGGPQGRSLLEETPEFAIIDGRLRRVRERAIGYLSAMGEEDIAAVARSFQKGILEGAVGQAAVEAFFRDERELVRGMPHMTVGHFDRMERRFNGLLADAAA